MTNSNHLSGDALDLVLTPGTGVTMCEIALKARSAGFGGILGPGFPGHSDHIHVDSGRINWRAPRCGM